MTCDFCTKDNNLTYTSNGHTICNNCSQTAAYYCAQKFLGSSIKGITGSAVQMFKDLMPKNK